MSTQKIKPCPACHQFGHKMINCPSSAHTTITVGGRMMNIVMKKKTK